MEANNFLNSKGEQCQKFFGKKKDFEPTFRNLLFGDDQMLEVTITKYRKKRTNKMNAYMWGEIVPKVAFGLQNKGYRLNPAHVDAMVIDMLKNMTNNGAHEYLKQKFDTRYEVDEETGEINRIRPSTASMTIEDMQKYFDPIIQWAAEELEVEIKTPEQFYFDELILYEKRTGKI